MSTIAANQFVEASAGTGKTYYIVKAVVDMIAAGTPLESILVVTYTEKATGELRRRVRLGIEDRWREAVDANEAGQAALLRAAALKMDDAPIFTIHGFCQRMLGEYAFETGQSFSLQMLEGPDRSALFARLFARSLRGTWSRKILRMHDDPARCAEAFGADFYSDIALKVAGSFVKGDRLDPDNVSSLPNLSETVSRIIESLRPGLGGDVENSSLLARIGAVKMNGQSKKSVVTALTDLIELVGSFDAEATSQCVAALLDWPDSDRALGNLETLAGLGAVSSAELAAMQELTTLKVKGRAGMLAMAVADLNRSFDRSKRNGGTIDFNDMLVLLRDALSGSDDMVRLLRARYSCAIVDEFQDTDQVQWDIFRRAFLESESNRLIVVGDPKQAIYGFRGANILAYTAARSGFDSGEGATALATNYRSDPALLAALNQVFDGQGGWFDTARADIQYHRVAAPETARLRARLFADGSGRAPLTLVRTPAESTGAQSRAAFGRFAATEIAHLLESGIEIAAWQGGQAGKRRLNAGDICLLIGKRTEWPSLRRALRAAGIPSSFRRAGGLFVSKEALEWRYLLRAIAAPEKPRAVMKALFTRFFDCPAEQVETIAGQGRVNPDLSMIDEWHQLARKRDWNRLFRQILLQSNVLLRVVGGPEGDRTVTNHQHLAGLLQKQASCGGGSLNDLITYLDRRWARGDTEENLQRLETEKPRVQVMTMHAAKGLEFPIVFIAGGFTDGNRPGKYSTYSTESGRVYSFTGSEAAKDQQKREAADEVRRLYYVALTRAQYKLYLPVPMNKRYASAPLANFVRTAVEAAAVRGGNEWSAGVGELEIDAGGSIVGRGAVAAPVLHDGSALPLWDDQADMALDIAPTAPPPVHGEWGRRLPAMRSFTSLVGHAAIPRTMSAMEPDYSLANDDAAGGSPARAAERTDEEGGGPIPLAEPEDGEGALPRGAATGSLLHEVLQSIDFGAIGAAPNFETLLDNDTPSRKLIETKVAWFLPGRQAQRESDLCQVARLVWNALRTPLPFLNGFGLCEIDERRHEVEFLLPAEAVSSVAAPDIRGHDAYLNGFIDLVFRHEGRYYLLDWKSNGQAENDYSRPALDEMMAANRYDLQYKIYLLALDRMLRLSTPGYEPVTHLGGVCYLFLRGLEAGSENGIVYVPPSGFTIAELEAEVLGYLRPAGGHHT